ncbi:MAG: N-formylglutamate deformylase [Pirellulaceae bacterium]|jgi:N-formylglutamate deformylase
MSLPILMTIPHAGVKIPNEVREFCALDEFQINRDSAAQARQIFSFTQKVMAYVSTDIARAIVDVDRAAFDRTMDGVVKLNTRWLTPVYRTPLTETVIQELLENYYKPFHQQINAEWGEDLLMGITCRTFSPNSPPMGQNPSQRRGDICIGDRYGETMPPGWTAELGECFCDYFDDVTINAPFPGDFITKNYGQDLPWAQIAVTNGSHISASDKQRRVLAALTDFCERRSNDVESPEQRNEPPEKNNDPPQHNTDNGESSE